MESAVIFESLGQAVFREIDVPPPASGEVQLRTEVSVLSPGTEGWVLNNVFTWQPTVYPCIPGYQRVGTITQLGEGVTGWSVGDRVAATFGLGANGIAPMWGAHASLANSPAHELYRIPEAVTDLDAASFVVAQVGYNAASRLTLNLGDWVVVYGDGIIGQSAAQAARARGARVVLVGHRDERLSIARQQGIGGLVNRKQEAVLAKVQSIVGSATVAAVIDTIQGEDPQREFIDLLERARGQIVYAGFTSGSTWADMAVLQQRELTTHYVSGWTRARLEATLDLMATGHLNLRDLITHTVEARRAPEMWQMIGEKNEPFLGIALQWP